MPGVVVNCLQSPHLGRRVGRTRCSRSHSAKVRLRTAWVMGVLVPTSHHKTNKQTKLTRAAEMAQQVRSVCCANLIPWVWSLNALAGRNQFLRSILRPPHMRYGTCAPAPTQTRVPNKNKIKYICVYVCVFVCIKTTRMVKALATANSQKLSSDLICTLTFMCMYVHVHTCTHIHKVWFLLLFKGLKIQLNSGVYMPGLWGTRVSIHMTPKATKEN